MPMGWSLRAAHCKSFHVLECAIRDEASEARMTTPVPTSAAQDGVKTSHHGMPASGSAVNVVMLANGIGCPSLASSRDSHLSRSRKQKPMCPRTPKSVGSMMKGEKPGAATISGGSERALV